MTTTPPHFDLVHGDDFALYLLTSDPTAFAWRVSVQRPPHTLTSAPRLKPGTSLNPNRQVLPNEFCWEVGLSTLEPTGTLIIVRMPGTAEPFALAHPAAVPK